MKIPKKDPYFLAAIVIFFILGGIFDSGILLLAGWAMIIVELSYILIGTW
ncbi:MAG: hypothetical protein WCI72_02655 [archaeon]